MANQKKNTKPSRRKKKFSGRNYFFINSARWPIVAICSVVIGVGRLIYWTIELINDNVDRLYQRVYANTENISKVKSSISFIKGKLSDIPPDSSESKAEE
ncbi:MAG: hypothetical protein OXF23_05355 [Candidatus Dadabacteria bacterium]|nr:hypothetical protein [Candidatus Dadabacteria bacterium]